MTTMTDLFDFTAKPSAFAVMGNPVKHSKSPQIHRLFAQQFDIALDYTRIQVDVGGFGQALSHFSAHGGAGLNITLPYKVEAAQLCQKPPNSISQRARLAQAVNTLRFATDGVYGDNTDGAGLVADLHNNIEFSIKDRSILLIGAGGAARGVIGALLDCQPKEVIIANRTIDKANALSHQFGHRVSAVGLDAVPDQAVDLIINGTAASLSRQLTGISEQYINNSTVYDMMYADQPTIFMQWALSNGATEAYDGLGMLVEQAAESFYLWHGKRPDSRAVIHALRQL